MLVKIYILKLVLETIIFKMHFISWESVENWPKCKYSRLYVQLSV